MFFFKVTQILSLKQKNTHTHTHTPSPKPWQLTKTPNSPIVSIAKFLATSTSPWKQSDYEPSPIVVKSETPWRRQDFEDRAVAQSDC